MKRISILLSILLIFSFSLLAEDKLLRDSAEISDEFRQMSTEEFEKEYADEEISSVKGFNKSKFYNKLEVGIRGNYSKVVVEDEVIFSDPGKSIFLNIQSDGYKFDILGGMRVLPAILKSEYFSDQKIFTLDGTNVYLVGLQIDFDDTTKIGIRLGKQKIYFNDATEEDMSIQGFGDAFTDYIIPVGAGAIETGGAMDLEYLDEDSAGNRQFKWYLGYANHKFRLRFEHDKNYYKKDKKLEDQTHIEKQYLSIGTHLIDGKLYIGVFHGTSNSKDGVQTGSKEDQSYKFKWVEAQKVITGLQINGVF